MNKKFPRSFFSTISSKRNKRTLWQWLAEPTATITKTDERRQARLVSAILLAVIFSMSTGAVVSYYALHDKITSLILTNLVLGLGIAYALSRTRYYQVAVPIQLICYSAWPILSIHLTANYSSERLLFILIFDMFTILLSSTIASLRTTVFWALFHILSISLLPIFIPAISYSDIIVPLSFNLVGATLVLILTWHRNLLEKDRLQAVSQLNEQLQAELTERKRAEEQLAYSALHDHLTGLPNRVLFMDRLHHVMERAKRRKNNFYAILFLDLDRFKVVNDSLGHIAGDQLLIETASRLVTCLRREDTVARLGGDEFVILIEDIQDTEEVTRIADRIQHDLALPHDLEGHKVYAFSSMGIVLVKDSYERPEDILRNADIAMYRAKGQGRGRYEIFDPSMLDRVMTRLELEADLQKALERQEFVVHYQPILKLGTNRIVGFEALARWQHPTRGLVLPAEFIPTAEETGIIVPIGYWILKEACRQIRTWQIQFPADPPLTISVNWSTRQCAENNMAQKIEKVLEETGLDAHSLNLELTESLIMEDAESTTTRLSELRALGVQVHIDDFGTGYSSLGYLHDLPIDTLKIDRVFINRLGIRDNGSDIIRTILALAHGLGMKVVAEGVETDDQLSMLKTMNCEYVQGFLLARPVDSQEAGALLEKRFTVVDD